MRRRGIYWTQFVPTFTDPMGETPGGVERSEAMPCRITETHPDGKVTAVIEAGGGSHTRLAEVGDQPTQVQPVSGLDDRAERALRRTLRDLDDPGQPNRVQLAARVARTRLTGRGAAQLLGQLRGVAASSERAVAERVQAIEWIADILTATALETDEG